LYRIADAFGQSAQNDRICLNCTVRHTFNPLPDSMAATIRS
jgi:hypothetical protein